VLLAVSLHCFLSVPAGVNDVRSRSVRVVCRLLVKPTLVMLGGLSMVASGVCEVLRGLLVVFCSFLRHLRSSINKRQLVFNRLKCQSAASPPVRAAVLENFA
jgi:hypothetical protein